MICKKTFAMKTITDDLKSTLDSNFTHIVKCWKISLKHGGILAFSNNDTAFLYDGVEYNPTLSDVTDIKTSASIEMDTLYAENLISGELINADDICAGLFDNAEVEIFLLDPQHTERGKIFLLSGKISRIEYKDDIFIAHIDGIKNELNHTIGNTYSPRCRARFCDHKCKLSKEDYTYSATIDHIVDKNTFTTSDKEICDKSDEYFTNGVVTFATKELEIVQFSNGTFVLLEPIPQNIAVGDEFTVLAGCDKVFRTCCERFNNAINFRGEPHLPNSNIMLKIMF